MSLVEIISLIALPVLGFGSGGGFGNYSGFFNSLIGFVFGLLLGVTGVSLGAFAIAGFIAGITSPARYCTGLICDNYQVKPNREWAWFEIKYLRDRPWLGVAVRGAISALCFMPLLFVDLSVIKLLSFIVIWPLSLYAVVGPSDNPWQAAEIIRPFLVGGFIIIN